MKRASAVLLCAALAAGGCSQPSSGSTAGASRPPASSLLSGRAGRTDGPVIAVKVDNTASAHPQVGLDAADVVYVEEVEGGLTRVAALYSTSYPKAVGPVRSARISDIQLLRQYGSVGLVYSGSQRAMVDPLRRSGLKLLSLDADVPGFRRAADRSAPYNVMANLTTLRERAAEGVSTPTAVGYRFGPAPAGGRAAAELTVRWPAARLRATWSARERRWLLSMDGRASRTPQGRRLGPTTLVVQRVQVVPSPYRDVNRNTTPDSRTVGSGTALVLRDGRVYDARWSRPSDAAATTYTIGGAPAVFAPGQVWVALVGASRPVTTR
ncbi:MAG TPA: DUF3048 domain-containing protein [Actinomycetales bacterium]|nr:DUF3048 domain-containing protein [Actinomycetales bacterium]